MLTKLAHDYATLVKIAKEEKKEESSIGEDASYGASLGGKAGALYGGISGAATGGPLLAFPGALIGGIGGYLGGGLYGAAGGLGKDLLGVEKPEERSNLIHDAALLSTLGGGVGAVAGSGVLGKAKSGLKGAATGGLFGAGIGYLKDKDEQNEEE